MYFAETRDLLFLSCFPQSRKRDVGGCSLRLAAVWAKSRLTK